MRTPAKIVRITDLEFERNRMLQEELSNIGTQLKNSSPKLLNGEKVVFSSSHHAWIAEQIKRTYDATGDYDVNYKIHSNWIDLTFSIKKDKNL